MPAHLYPGSAGAGAARLAAALLRANLASPFDWKPGGFGRTSTTNPPEFLSETIWQWIGPERAKRIREFISFQICLQPGFWDRQPEESADAWLCMWPTARAAWWEPERDVRVWHLGGALGRLHGVDPRLANFVFYALVDALRRIGPVYDWSSAAAEYDRQWGQALSLSPAAARELGLTHVGDGDPRHHVPAWLRRRKRLAAAEAMAIAHGDRYAWTRKVTEAAVRIAGAAAQLRRRNLDRYPVDTLQNLAGLVETPPIAVVALEEMDPTEGMGREHVRTLKVLDGKASGPAKALSKPAVCLPLAYDRPATLRRAKMQFQALCATLEAASTLLRHLDKWAFRPGRKKEMEQRIPIPVMVR